MSDQPLSFRATLAAALADMAVSGYVSQKQLNGWLARLREAAERELGDPQRVEDAIRESMTSIFERLTRDGGRLEKMIPGVPRFTLEMVKPKLRDELDRRIIAAADLIKYNRQEAVDKTLRRFAGWATSIPPKGGPVDTSEAKALMAADLRKYRYHARLVKNDQGHKLIANIAEITAVGSGAVAGKWNSHFRDASYNYRESHKERDGKYYVLKDAWAYTQGLITKGDGFYDDITHVGIEINCRCWMTWITSIRNLPAEMITPKGREWIERGDRLARGIAA